ncbi:MAG: hypothetical protein ACI4W2_12490 [Eubacterium sp.]
MYKIYIDGLLFPVAPPTIDTKINGRNETIDLASGHQINMLKEAGLTDIEMDLRLPNVKYPWAQYGDEGFQSAQVYLDKLEECKKMKSQEGFDLVIIRELDGVGTVQTDKIDNATENAEIDVAEGLLALIVAKMLGMKTPDIDEKKIDKYIKGVTKKAVDNYAIQVSLEDYTIKEDAEEGYDWVAECSFKEWRDWGTKTIKIQSTNKSTGSKSKAITKISKGKKRKRKKKQKASAKVKATKTKSGKTKTTCLWTLCKGAYGYGDTWSNVVLQDKRNVASLKAAAKKMKIKWGGLTSDWATKQLPAGTKIYFPKSTWSPKATKSTKKK